MQALQLDASAVTASDVDASARAFICQNFQVQHLYETMESQMNPHKVCFCLFFVFVFESSFFLVFF